MKSFTVKTQTFEGPLEVLFELITKRKLHISEISLALVVDDFIEHISITNYSHEELLHFLKILSTLLLIKSRSSIPTITPHEQEEINLLTESLKEYNAIREKANILKNRYQSVIISPYIEQKKDYNTFIPDTSITKTVLENIYSSFFKQEEKKQTLKQLTLPKKVSMRDITHEVFQKIKRFSICTLDHLFEQKTRQEKITTFCAILELIRSQKVTASQNGDVITIESKEISTPAYGAFS